MKARVKATGEIIEVKAKTYIANSRWDIGTRYEDIDRNIYYKEDLDFESFTEKSTDVKEKSFPKDEPDYWEKLYHQAAIATMQGILTNNELWCDIMRGVYPPERQKYLAKEVNKYAAELVNKLKEESQCEK